MRHSGYLTVYMALMIGVLISLCLCLVEGVRYKAGRVESKCASEAALNAVMAEYSRGLLELANIYALDMSYGGNEAELQLVKNRFNMYALGNIELDSSAAKDFLSLKITDCDISNVGFITDDNGVIFREQAIESWEYEHGLAEVTAITEILDIFNSRNLVSEGIRSIKEETQSKINEYEGREIEINGVSRQVEIEDPTSELESLRGTGILPLVTDTSKLSKKLLNSNGLYETRLENGTTNRGNVGIEESSEVMEIADKIMFSQYLCDNMGYFGKETEDSDTRALEYQIEYLLTGKASDGENLSSVVLKISGIREVINMAYLLSDEVKCEEAEALALTFSAVLLIPELEGLFKTSILASWAYAESLYDVSQLLNGERVPLLKSAETWHFGLEEALNNAVGELEDLMENIGGDSDESSGDGGLRDGLNYRDYLSVLLILSDIDRTTIRAMTMVEADMRLTNGNEAFRMDNCIAILRVNTTYGNARGYSYSTSCRGVY